MRRIKTWGFVITITSQIHSNTLAKIKITLTIIYLKKTYGVNASWLPSATGEETIAVDVENFFCVHCLACCYSDIRRDGLG